MIRLIQTIFLFDRLNHLFGYSAALERTTGDNTDKKECYGHKHKK